jgi:aldehyde dehydrogenase (NAD+)
MAVSPVPWLAALFPHQKFERDMTTPVMPSSPFGGVGASGVGACHGAWGFETQSHRRGVVVRSARPDPRLVYPPYSSAARKLTRRIF